jgi:hypothetical protein
MNLFRDSLGGRMPLAGVRPFPWFRRRDARYGGRRGFQLPQTSIHRILEINPRGEAALKPLPLKPVSSTLQPTLQYPKGEKSPADKPTHRYIFGRAGISGASQGFRVPTAQSSIFGSLDTPSLQRIHCALTSVNSQTPYDSWTTSHISTVRSGERSLSI